MRRLNLLLPLACLALASCSTYRAAARDWNNADLVGEVAPGLELGEWVGEEVRVDGDWYLVCFLRPS